MADEQLEAIRYALDLAREHGFEEVELRFGDCAFEGKLGATNGRAPMPLPIDLPVTEPPANEPKIGTVTIDAPCVGIYQSGKSLLGVGQVVAMGEIVATITALGLENEVESAVSGEVIEVLVEPGAPVEFGQPIARVRVQA